MEPIDLKTWKRREAFAFFSRISNPFYMVTFRQDVTNLSAYAKRRGLSFYYAMVWACARSINQVDAFRVALRDGKPYYLPERKPSFTDLRKNSEQFHIVTMDLTSDPEAFCAEAARISQAQEGFVDEAKETDDLIYLSCLPWFEMTAFTNERDLSAPGARDDSIPRLAWGRYAEENGRKVLGLSVEVNHRLIDGVHIGRFAENLTACIQSL
ncbi:MAG: hypothetical protein IJ174_05925 [Clostridia bacterium]|nr:hypothetical protein [Clostridia bacterium]